MILPPRLETIFYNTLSPSPSRSRTFNHGTYLEIRCVAHDHPPRPGFLQHRVDLDADLLFRVQRPTPVPYRPFRVVHAMLCLSGVVRQAGIRVWRVWGRLHTVLQPVQEGLRERVDPRGERRQLGVVGCQSAMDKGNGSMRERGG